MLDIGYFSVSKSFTFENKFLFSAHGGVGLRNTEIQTLVSRLSAMKSSFYVAAALNPYHFIWNFLSSLAMNILLFSACVLSLSC